jgi:hypothetical protein
MDHSITRQQKLITREELYKQVWETPMSRLGKEYGLTDNGLRKICARLNVPCPPRGYRWCRFMEMAHQWRDTEIASGFIAALKQLPMDEATKLGDKDMGEWIRWAEQQLVSRNPLNKGIEQVLDSVSKVTTWTYHNR